MRPHIHLVVAGGRVRRIQLRLGVQHLQPHRLRPLPVEHPHRIANQRQFPPLQRIPVRLLDILRQRGPLRVGAHQGDDPRIILPIRQIRWWSDPQRDLPLFVRPQRNVRRHARQPLDRGVVLGPWIEDDRVVPPLMLAMSGDQRCIFILPVRIPELHLHIRFRGARARVAEFQRRGMGDRTEDHQMRRYMHHVLLSNAIRDDRERSRIEQVGDGRRGGHPFGGPLSCRLASGQHRVNGHAPSRTNISVHSHLRNCEYDTVEQRPTRSRQPGRGPLAGARTAAAACV